MNSFSSHAAYVYARERFSMSQYEVPELKYSLIILTAVRSLCQRPTVVRDLFSEIVSNSSTSLLSSLTKINQSNDFKKSAVAVCVSLDRAGESGQHDVTL